MRGLTAVERELLQRRADNVPRVYYPKESDAHAACQKLALDGRLIRRPEDDERSPTGVLWRVYITDLGRLALRVCPIE